MNRFTLTPIAALAGLALLFVLLAAGLYLGDSGDSGFGRTLGLLALLPAVAFSLSSLGLWIATRH